MTFTTILAAMCTLCASAFPISQRAPQDSVSDTTRVLEEVRVMAFFHRKPSVQVPAAIGLLTSVQMDRFSNTNLLPVFNTVPGVRMEERSPGSYRLSIRGSSLRSPFGIRNVKVYWNGMPLTDASGNTYLNLLDFGSVRYAEIIRGPGSSLYGAGTGGVVLLESGRKENGVHSEWMAGSYGMFRAAAGVRLGDAKKSFSVQVSRQSYDGYRIQSAMHRTMLQLESSRALNSKNTLTFSGFYSDLDYQTPGGLTQAQFDADPRQARPAGGPNAGAVEQQATVYNRTFLGGLTLTRDWNEKWTSTLTVFGNVTAFRNPAIRNYEQRAEDGMGLRFITEHPMRAGRLTFGAELQQGGSHITIYQNNSGIKGNLTSDAKAPVGTRMLFAQADFDLPHNFFLTAGFSMNQYVNRFTQMSPQTFDDRQQSVLVPVPRIALSKKAGRYFTFYGNAGQGYSPPTTAEIFPSTASYNKDLLAEVGTSSEAGVRWNAGPFSGQLLTYHLSVRNTIVVTRDQSGADYFFNSGRTRQRGTEATFSWQPRWENARLRGWMSYSRSDYSFVQYTRNNVDYSGNQLTGTPTDVVVAGVDWTSARGFYANVTATYTARLPLDDANTVWAPEYYVYSCRVGYRTRLGKLPVDIFAGAENLLDRRYSLGNDLNAAAGRYFNVAPGRSLFGGVRFSLAGQ